MFFPYCYRVLLTLLFVVELSGTAFSQTDSQSKTTVLPSPMTQRAIENLHWDPGVYASGEQLKYRELRIDPQTLPEDGRDKVALDSDGQANLPFVVPNTMILQFESDVTESEIEEFIKSRNLEVIQTFPKIGAIQVETDLTGYFVPHLGDDDANQATLRGLVTAIEDFKKDDRIRSAAPDLVLRDQSGTQGDSAQITNLLTPSNIVVSDTQDASETTDWGIADIEADALWDMPGAQDGVLFGVMDVGFSRHEDLTFLELPRDTDVDDHGNHVAAIACGRHNDRGVRGVLPNCFVRARSGDVFFDSDEGGEVLEFFVLFSQVLSTLNRFVDVQDDVHTFNVSLGYNWRSNFGINPDLQESAQWRTLVANHGTILVSLLDLAQQSDKVIYSAAGNDSTGLDEPIGAKFASPFNWAAITAREQGISQSGVIVEAHSNLGERAPFSNKDGHISCPGVNIFSALAFDPAGAPSASAYGTMSGTSMASPYCAAGHQLFRLVRPGYAGVEVVDCLLASSDQSSSGAPMMRLTQALASCPPRS